MEEVIRQELFKYGFVPLLITLERMESLQEYEVCRAIINVIKDTNKELNMDIPTVLNGESVAQMKIAFMTKFNLSGDIAHKNSEWYADEIMMVINKEIINKV